MNQHYKDPVIIFGLVAPVLLVVVVLGLGLHFRGKFEKTYDFALSFAGDDRQVAKKIAERLRQKEIAVFYDHDEQSEIMASDVETYLNKIYALRRPVCCCA